MAVRQNERGDWVADVTVGKRLDGSRDRRQPTFRTKREAEREETRLNILKEKNRGKSYGGILLKDFIDDYFWPQKTNLRSSTVRGYKRDIRLRLKPMLGDVAVEDIDRYKIQKLISSCETKKVATNARETLSSILTLAREMELITVNPAGFHYSYPPSTKRPEDADGEWLTSWDEIKRVLSYLAAHHPDEPVHRIAVLGLGFGLRKGEIIAAHTSKLKLTKRYLYIDETCTRGEHGDSYDDPKTPRAFRPVPTVKMVEPWLKKWQVEGGYFLKENGLLLTTGQASKRVANVFENECFDDGTKLPRLTMASMRHSFATACVNAGVEISKLSKWMGHCDTHTTQKYYVKQKLQNLTEDANLIDSLMC